MTQTVLLTGITGFIAKRIAYDLLAAGYAVKGSLRSISRVDEVRAAVAKAGNLDRLSFVVLDLNSDAGWNEAMVGVDAVLHTASPFPLAEPKDEQSLIRPAVDGALRALRAAQHAGVHRVVLTSSIVSVVSVDKPAGVPYGPEDWSDVDHPTASAYVKSKTLAERAAWSFVAAHPEMQLTVINPGLVVGTPMDKHYGASLELIERIMSGKDPAQPQVSISLVDVKDVSALHVGALSRPQTIGNRYIACDASWMFPQIAKVISDAYPARKVATRTAPSWLMKLIGLFDPTVRGIIPSLGVDKMVENSATCRDFDFTFTPAKEAILASALAVDTLAKG
jgi:dihydroflavonol-4-reductase